MILCTSSGDDVRAHPWRPWIAFGLAAVMLGLAACSHRPSELQASDATPSTMAREVDQLAVVWSSVALSTPPAGQVLVALHRAPLVKPARYRLWVVPGSGCLGWLPLAQRYFAGLLHAELVVLHKPGVNPWAGPLVECSPDFVARDSLDTWRDAAVSAVSALHRTPHTSHALPQLLLGISEGAELLPDLAAVFPELAGVVMLSAPGLNPVEVGELQALRLGHSEVWLQLQAAQASDLDHLQVVQGRTLGYWRAFWHWELAERLLGSPWPLMRVWGDADELVPASAYLRFSQRAASRIAPFCDLRLAGADHALQSDGRDGLQWLWAQLERWGRSSERGFCDVVHSSWGP